MGRFRSQECLRDASSPHQQTGLSVALALRDD